MSFFELFVEDKQKIHVAIHDNKNRIHSLVYTYPIKINKFIHVMVTWVSGGVIKLFIDGIEVSYINLNKDIDFSRYIRDYYFGCKHDITNCFSGQMHDVKMWGVALKDDEINSLYYMEK